jgi:hypothetical protein
MIIFADRIKLKRSFGLNLDLELFMTGFVQRYSRGLKAKWHKVKSISIKIQKEKYCPVVPEEKCRLSWYIPQIG